MPFPVRPERTHYAYTRVYTESVEYKGALLVSGSSRVLVRARVSIFEYTAEERRSRTGREPGTRSYFPGGGKKKN